MPEIRISNCRDGKEAERYSMTCEQYQGCLLTVACMFVELGPSAELQAEMAEHEARCEECRLFKAGAHIYSMFLAVPPPPS